MNVFSLAMPWKLSKFQAITSALREITQNENTHHVNFWWGFLWPQDEPTDFGHNVFMFSLQSTFWFPSQKFSGLLPSCKSLDHRLMTPWMPNMELFLCCGWLNWRNGIFSWDHCKHHAIHENWKISPAVWLAKKVLSHDFMLSQVFAILPANTSQIPLASLKKHQRPLPTQHQIEVKKRLLTNNLHSTYNIPGAQKIMTLERA